MQCEHGYTKPGVRGILCKKCEEPRKGDVRGLANALCGHQRFCPNQRCFQMMPGWEKCVKRRETREENAEAKKTAEADKPKGRKRSARKGSENA